MKKIIRRVFSILPAVILQLVWLCILFTWLAPWAAAINLLLSVLSLLFVLYITTKQDEGTYKILWLLVILTVPLPGTILYLLFGNKRTTKPLRKRLEQVSLSPAQADDTRQIYEALETEDRRMAQTFQCVQRTTGFPLCVNTQAVYFPLGDELFPAMLEEMKKAERFIFAEYFIVENGLMWDSIVEIMAEKAAQGVDVRVMYDDLGSISTYSKENVKTLQKRGIQCIAFNPLTSIKGTLNYRDHRKMLVIDGKAAFSGGVNLADEYINHVEKFGHWKDVGFRLTGSGVANYTRMFAEFWNAFSNNPIPDELLAGVPKSASETQDGYILSYYDSPLRHQPVSNELYIELLSQAKDSAWFFTPYLMLGDALLDAFVRAARRGIDVRIIMPGVPDKKLVFRMSRSFYPVLLEAGVKIYEYTPGFVHAKGCVVDGIVGTVGTVNLDYRSLFLHFENNSLFYRASLLEAVKSDFLDTQAQCREMKLGENVNINFWHWILDGILRIFAPLC
ncbi:MAG: cardiolipin synthase [Oscillospiraceae bacterium]|nr:cardiolipin synthase [Oscillospiraceae bacterium]